MKVENINSDDQTVDFDNNDRKKRMVTQDERKSAAMDLTGLSEFCLRSSLSGKVKLARLICQITLRRVYENSTWSHGQCANEILCETFFSSIIRNSIEWSQKIATFFRLKIWKFGTYFDIKWYSRCYHWCAHCEYCWFRLYISVLPNVAHCQARLDWWKNWQNVTNF